MAIDGRARHSVHAFILVGGGRRAWNAAPYRSPLNFIGICAFPSKCAIELGVRTRFHVAE